jgi:hypothetical protein
MVKSYYEAAGDWTPGREGREFDIALSYSKVCSITYLVLKNDKFHYLFIKIEKITIRKERKRKKKNSNFSVLHHSLSVLR